MLNQICVITIKVRDLKSAVNFYSEILDFKVSKHYGDKIVSLVHNDVPVVLEESADEKTESNVLPGTLSKNIESDFSRMREAGVKMLFENPQPCPSGRYFTIENPSGNQIEIVEFSN